MRIIVTLEYRFAVLPDGTLWTSTTFPYSFWRRYLEVFDEVKIVARALPVNEVENGWREATGDGVTCSPIPYYVGPMQYLAKMGAVKNGVISSFSEGDAVLLRVGSRLGSVMRSELVRRGYPYGVEVVADPFDVFAKGAMNHPLRAFFRLEGYLSLKRACNGAAVAGYVTQEALQKRYPAGENSYTAGFSDVVITPRDRVLVPREFKHTPDPLRLVMVGGLNQLYKAPHILIDAMVLVCKKMNARVTFVGGGQFTDYLKNRAVSAGIGDKVAFPGELAPGSAIWEQLDSSDLFVLPSFQEGLPRAMVEAMARGLPCIGSNVGGMSELISEDYLVRPGRAAELASKIISVGKDPNELSRMSHQNLMRSSRFTEEKLSQTRNDFYQELKSRTEQFCKQVV